LPENVYLFALACYKLGKYSEAEKALRSSAPLHSPNYYEFVPNSASGLYLLGLVSMYCTAALLHSIVLFSFD
jgi:hypothetical protein